MIITINVDCTPEEARAFLGLPDLKPMQDKITQQMQDVFRQMTGAKHDK